MSQQHLGINISETHVEFSILDGKTILHHFAEAYTGRTDSDKKESVRSIISANAALNKDFSNVTLAWCHPQSTLVPSSIFSESSPKELFQLCFGADASEGTIDHNRIFELSVVNVYSIPDWVKSLFVIKFPRIIIQHAGTHQIREVLGSNAFYIKASILIQENNFLLTIVKHNNLEFYSTFTYQSAEDVIYHLNFVLQQKEMLGEKGTIELSSAAGGNQSTCEEVSKGLSKIQHLNKMKIELHDSFLTKSQLLCV